MTIGIKAFPMRWDLDRARRVGRRRYVCDEARCDCVSYTTFITT